MGGAQKLLGDLLPLLANAEDIDIKVAVCRLCGSDIEKKLKAQGIDIVSLNTGLRSPNAIIKLLPLMKKADVVHAHLFPINYIVALTNILIGKPLIYTEHSTHNKRRNHKWMRGMEKWMYGRYLKVACISEPTETALINWVGQKPILTKSTVIENGIDLESYRESQASAQEALFGRTGNPVLMISRFTDSKDHPTLLKALTLIEDPDVFVVFVGDGERRMEMESLAEELGVKDRTVFMGTRTDIPPIIKACRIGVQASNWEGFGLTAIEMMASGIPVIASNVEGLNKVVENAGMLFKRSDARDLARKIKKLLSDHSLYESLVKHGQKKASRYSIQRTAKSYLELYRNIKTKDR